MKLVSDFEWRVSILLKNGPWAGLLYQKGTKNVGLLYSLRHVGTTLEYSGTTL